MSVLISSEMMRDLFNTANDGAKSLEDGDIEPGYSALDTIRFTLWDMADRQGVTLKFPDEEEED